MKCFQSGMKNEMIRPSRSKPNKIKEKETIESSTQIKSNAIEQVRSSCIRKMKKIFHLFIFIFSFQY
jgi:ribosomal protein L16/L10AE